MSEPLARRGGTVGGRAEPAAMTTQTTPRARIRHRTALAVALLAISLLTVWLLVSTTSSTHQLETTAGDTWYDGEGEGPPRWASARSRTTRSRSKPSYPARATGPARRRRSGSRRRSTTCACGSSTPAPSGARPSETRRCAACPSPSPFCSAGSGVGRLDPDPDRQLAERPLLRAAHRQGGRIGYAPFVVPPRRLGEHRVAVVLPTRTWQAYNFRDADGDGTGTPGTRPEDDARPRLDRPFLNRGVPPHFRGYDLPFLRWLSRPGKEVDYLSQADSTRCPTRRRCARAYDLHRLPRAPRVRHDAGVRRRRGLPRSRRQPRVALGRTTSSGGSTSSTAMMTRVG